MKYREFMKNTDEKSFKQVQRGKNYEQKTFPSHTIETVFFIIFLSASQ